MDIIQLLNVENINTDEDAYKIVKKKYVESTANTVVNVNSIYSITNKNYLQRLICPKSLYQYDYILLDTNNVDPNISTDTTYGWNVINYTTQEPGFISINSNARDLVGMRIFPMTTKLTAPVGEVGKTYLNNIVNLNHNFTVLIHEFQAQSYIGRDGRKFHFVLFPQLMNPNTSEMSPPYTPADPYLEFTTSGKMNGWFWFRKPITTFSTITISIGNPFDLVKLSQTVRTLIPIQLVFLKE